MADELAYRSARALRDLVLRREISCVELLEATLQRIERVNPGLNAIVTLAPERARADAQTADERLARGERVGPLHGLPIAHKDLVNTAGIRTTYGSAAFRDHVPSEDDLIVTRLRAAGAITVGKTNTPEFGAGSQTFNEVFGATRNPYDPGRTCGGSSGGAAVSLAAGMLAVADGSDMGGSLRNPANFCNVVGLRPSPGRVPHHPISLPWSPLGVLGPMARNAADCALLLAAMAGEDPRDPLSRPAPADLADVLDRDFRGVRLAWSDDLGGLPVDRDVRRALQAKRSVFDELGCIVDDAEPDLRGAAEIFQVLRAFAFASGFAEVSEGVFAQLKETLRWNIEKGRALSVGELLRAEQERTALFHRAREFMERHEFLLLPVSQVPPFDVDVEWIREIDGVALETYIDWMRSCSDITLTGLPAASVPCGFTEGGLPVGLQIVGRFGDEQGVLALAHAFEQATGTGERRPPLDRDVET